METRNVEAYAQMHRDQSYGTTAVKMRRYIEPWVQLSAPRTLLDYGAGQGRFGAIIDVPSVTERHLFDPAIPEIAALQKERYDYVICIDVLEHLEPDEVDGVLADIARLTDRALIIVTTAPAQAILPDGRNAHTTIRSGPWWGERIRAAFGTAVKIPVWRKNRAGFKTYTSPPGEWMAFAGKLAAAQARHHRAKAAVKRAG
ncbi:hypothetical protein ATO13_03210 [Stappia sp. 22II-S9-Z10]|nr:hypothetical protein ATO13_03210 [Stappia sp. 22II-S9-Z10]